MTGLLQGNEITSMSAGHLYKMSHNDVFSRPDDGMTGLRLRFPTSPSPSPLQTRRTPPTKIARPRTFGRWPALAWSDLGNVVVLAEALEVLVELADLFLVRLFRFLADLFCHLW